MTVLVSVSGQLLLTAKVNIIHPLTEAGFKVKKSKEKYKFFTGAKKVNPVALRVPKIIKIKILFQISFCMETA